MRMNDLMQANTLKGEVSGMSERTFLKTFERKWREDDLFSVNLMVSWSEDCFSPAAHVRFKELYRKLSAAGFNNEEKNAIAGIRHYEAEIRALEKFLKKEGE